MGEGSDKNARRDLQQRQEANLIAGGSDGVYAEMTNPSQRSGVAVFFCCLVGHMLPGDAKTREQRPEILLIRAPPANGARVDRLTHLSGAGGSDRSIGLIKR